MLFLLSPAKKLDYDSVLKTTLHTEPLFVDRAKELINVLRKKSVEEISELMSLSASLAKLNYERYQKWSPEFTLENSRPAVLAFNGDVYEGLQAADLSDKDLKWAQDHVAILSGLYGVLRPLDLMQPYRLEMGTKLKNPRGENLYDFWKDVIAPYLNERLANEAEPTVINLASEEYFKSVDTSALNARVIQCIFQDEKAGKWKVISFFAKRARGLMARFAIKHKVTNPEKLKDFNLEGYKFAESESSDLRLVFRRAEHWDK